MPSASIGVARSARPAVSSSRTGTPAITSVPSTTSRVVPGVAATIARSCPSSAFSRLDLPAFGRPTSATVTPSCTSRPRRAGAQQRAHPRARVTDVDARADGVGRRRRPRRGNRGSTSSPRDDVDERRRAARSILAPTSPASARAASIDRALGARADQQRHGFRAREIHPAVHERAARELAGRRQPRARATQALDDHRAAAAGPP